MNTTDYLFTALALTLIVSPRVRAAFLLAVQRLRNSLARRVRLNEDIAGMPKYIDRIIEFCHQPARSPMPLWCASCPC